MVPLLFSSPTLPSIPSHSSHCPLPYIFSLPLSSCHSGWAGVGAARDQVNSRQPGEPGPVRESLPAAGGEPATGPAG